MYHLCELLVILFGMYFSSSCDQFEQRLHSLVRNKIPSIDSRHFQLVNITDRTNSSLTALISLQNRPGSYRVRCTLVIKVIDIDPEVIGSLKAKRANCSLVEQPAIRFDYNFMDLWSKYSTIIVYLIEIESKRNVYLRHVVRQSNTNYDAQPEQIDRFFVSYYRADSKNVKFYDCKAIVNRNETGFFVYTSNC